VNGLNEIGSVRKAIWLPSGDQAGLAASFEDVPLLVELQ